MQCTSTEENDQEKEDTTTSNPANPKTTTSTENQTNPKTTTNASKPENKVYSYSNLEDVKTFTLLELDDTHANLLNPTVAKDSYEEVKQVWGKLHNDIGTFLSEKDFQWNSSDSSIRVFHKIYFDKQGYIKHHFINVISTTIEKEKKVEFAQLLQEFDATYQVKLSRNSPFAQCGPTRYSNQ